MPLYVLLCAVQAAGGAFSRTLHEQQGPIIADRCVQFMKIDAVLAVEINTRDYCSPNWPQHVQDVSPSSSSAADLQAATFGVSLTEAACINRNLA